MYVFEKTTHAFVVRIWLEDKANPNKRAVWTGHITHVPSGEKKYFQNLWEVIDFMSPYLEEAGIKKPWYWRLSRWFLY